MKNKLPKTIKKHESGIVNLDSYSGNGTHWTTYIKKGKKNFNSYGNLCTSSELNSYFYSDNNKSMITYHYNKHHTFNQTNYVSFVQNFFIITYDN